MSNPAKPQSSVQHEFLTQLLTSRQRVSVFLKSGIKLTGYIEQFDQEALILTNEIPQIIHMHAIATIVP